MIVLCAGMVSVSQPVLGDPLTGTCYVFKTPECSKFIMKKTFALVPCVTSFFSITP